MVYTALETRARPFAVVVGDARGFDLIVWACCVRLGIPRMRFKYIRKLGRAGDHARDTKMLKWALARDPDASVLAGWDGSSPGTKATMDKGEKLGMQVWRITYYESSNQEA